MKIKSPYNSVHKSLQFRSKVPTNQLDSPYHCYQDSLQYRSRVYALCYEIQTASDFLQIHFKCNNSVLINKAKYISP